MQFAGIRHAIVWITLTVIAILCDASPAFGFTPESPEVRAMVRRAVRFLARDHLYDEQHRALSAMALFKAGEPETHPLIAKSISECMD